MVKDDGALGAVLSTDIYKADDVDEVLPALSVAVAVNEYDPSLRVDEVIEKAPLLSAVAEPKSVEPS